MKTGGRAPRKNFSTFFYTMLRHYDLFDQRCIMDLIYTSYIHLNLMVPEKMFSYLPKWFIIKSSGIKCGKEFWISNVSLFVKWNSSQHVIKIFFLHFKSKSWFKQRFNQRSTDWKNHTGGPVGPFYRVWIVDRVKIVDLWLGIHFELQHLCFHDPVYLKIH